MHGYRILLAGLAVATLPAFADAQQPTRRRQAPIEIRGQVPTPQVVTVRPREVPAYSRQVLVPRFYNHDFWPDIQLGYQLVPERQLTGQAVSDSAGVSADSVRMPMQKMEVAPDTLRRVTPADTARRPPGTAPARSSP